MRNPFGSERSAFWFAGATAAAFAAITVAAILGGPAAVVVLWPLLTVVVLAAYLPRARGRSLRTAPAHVGPPDEHRLLIVTEGDSLPDSFVADVHEHADRVLVVAPAVAPPARRWTSDIDAARAQAQRRLDAALDRLRAAHVEAEGTVGDSDAIQAVEDALRSFGGDEIAVAAPLGGSGAALERGLRERFALPVVRVAA